MSSNLFHIHKTPKQDILDRLHGDEFDDIDTIILITSRQIPDGDRVSHFHYSSKDIAFLIYCLEMAIHKLFKE